MITKERDADDLAAFAATFLKALGYPVKFRVTRSPERPYFHGVHVLAGLPRDAPTKVGADRLVSPT